ncbi:MAG: DUF6152 family protein [Pseudomonadales bacterium]|nr:DUF6152 family protein [Pseudomonadales bacterium]
MKTNLFALTAFLLGAFGSAQVLAHHSFAAEFDSQSPINITGTVVKVDWTNPHTYFYLEVENNQGDIEEWALEMGSPNGLMRRGWTRDTLQIGAEVIVQGTRARDGSFKGNVRSVMFADTCQRLFAGTSDASFNEDAAAAQSGCKQ